jgi:hypothetical protein
MSNYKLSKMDVFFLTIHYCAPSRSVKDNRLNKAFVAILGIADWLHSPLFVFSLISVLHRSLWAFPTWQNRLTQKQSSVCKQDLSGATEWVRWGGKRTCLITIVRLVCCPTLLNVLTFILALSQLCWSKFYEANVTYVQQTNKHTFLLEYNLFHGDSSYHRDNQGKG